MSGHTLGPRVLLNGTQDAQFQAIGETATITRIHALALDCDDAEQPLVARQIELAEACTCHAGDLLRPLILKRERLDQAQRQLTERAQRHVGSLAAFQRTANGYLEQLRTLVCRFLAAGGTMDPPVQIASYRRQGPTGGAA